MVSVSNHARTALLALCLAATSASAEDAYEHKGSLGLIVSGGAEVRSSVVTTTTGDNGFRGDLDIGGTFAFGRHWNALLEGRVSLGGKLTGVAFIVGLRNFFGERFKTFFDLSLAIHATPGVTIGPRIAFGVQYELSPVIGVFALGAVQFSGGQGLRLIGELMAGAQFRTYLFE